MARAHFSKRVGVHCGSVCCASGTVVLAVIYAAASLAVSLTARLYLRAFYHAAHVSGLGFFIGGFVLTHHIFKLHKCLGIKVKTFCAVQCFLNVWAFLASLAIGVSYSLLICSTIHLSWDFIGAVVFAWLNTIWMLYLLILTAMGSRGDWYSSYDIGGPRAHKYQAGNGHEMKSMDNGATSNGDTRNDVDVMSSSRGCCVKCFCCCCNVIFGFFFVIFHLIFAVVILLSAYHPGVVVRDMWDVFTPDQQYMHTVEINGHRPLALFLRCRGNGSETIVYENGLGGLAYAQWDIMPKFLEKDYRFCVHDRRGYGWSESFEYDYLKPNQDQWAKTNVQFFKALMEKANISQFYYMGHSYGGIHVGFVAALYPELVKGLIFLDSMKFSASSLLDDIRILEVGVNLQPLGLFRLAFHLGIIDARNIFETEFKFANISDDILDRLQASVTGGLYLTSFMREKRHLQNDFVRSQLKTVLKGSVSVDIPIIVIDAADRANWFDIASQQYFSKWKSEFYAQVPGSDHQSLVYGFNESRITAQLVDAFIKYDKKQITLEDFTRIKSELLGQDTK